MNETCGRSDPLYYGKGPATAVANSDHRRRFTEHAIPLHAPLFVVGHAREREEIVAPEIAADKQEPLFLISTRSEKQVSRGFRLGFWLLGVLGAVLAVGGFVAAAMVAKREPAADVPLFSVVAAAFVLAWLLGWIWMVYNSLIDLRQRVRQAWSNVDVQLKRRADLIPILVNVVSGLRDYERNVQTEVTALRTQLEATRPGETGPGPAAVAPSIRAVAEAYPELKANESFLNLQRQPVGDRAADRAGPFVLQRDRDVLQHAAAGRARQVRGTPRPPPTAGTHGRRRLRARARAGGLRGLIAPARVAHRTNDTTSLRPARGRSKRLIGEWRSGTPNATPTTNRLPAATGTSA